MATAARRPPAPHHPSPFRANVEVNVSDGSSRVPFIVAAGALRASIDAAVAKPRTPTELRVLLAVHSLTAAWSRLEDRVSIEQIAKAAGLDAGQRNRVRSALRQLADDGAIVYRPGKDGRGHSSVIGIPPDPNGVSTDPVSMDGKRGQSGTETGSIRHRNGVSADPLPRGYPSTPKKEGRRDRRPPSTTSPWGDAPGGLIEL